MAGQAMSVRGCADLPPQDVFWLGKYEAKVRTLQYEPSGDTLILDAQNRGKPLALQKLDEIALTLDDIAENEVLSDLRYSVTCLIAEEILSNFTAIGPSSHPIYAGLPAAIDEFLARSPSSFRPLNSNLKSINKRLKDPNNFRTTPCPIRDETLGDAWW